MLQSAGQAMGSRAAAELAVQTIQRAFEDHHEDFRHVTRHAKRHFELRDWQAIRSDTVERGELYTGNIGRTIRDLAIQLGEAAHSREVWAEMKSAYTRAILGRNDFELAETFFNSLTRIVFPHDGVDPTIDYVSNDFPLPFAGWEMASARMYAVRRVDPVVIQKILERAGLEAPFQDLARDSAAVATRVNQALTETFGTPKIESLDFLEPVFIRNKAAYIIGRARREGSIVPLVLALLNEAEGLRVDAVLANEAEVSRLFSFARWYFHADLASPREVIGFLHSILPRKQIAELYISLGYNKHGKSEFYRDLIGYIAGCEERFEVAPGQPGQVMAVFTLPSYEFVFKVIKDWFPPTKSTTREEIRQRYRTLMKRDRVGRLVDYQEFEHVKFPRARFDEELLEELQDVAGETVTLDGDDVAIGHMYVGRRVIPLDLYLREAAPAEAERAMAEWGRALRDLAAADIFTGDMLTKNFGLTRHDRVVFYDYDEVTSITECRFRRIPEPRSEFDEMAAEPWYTVADEDVFPEELDTFLGVSGTVRAAFEAEHSELFGVDYWRRVQEQVGSGEMIDFFPYSDAQRLLPAAEAGRVELESGSVQGDTR
jgi:isocitrate dehydrogenase kinase/phosphatase